MSLQDERQLDRRSPGPYAVLLLAGLGMLAAAATAAVGEEPDSGEAAANHPLTLTNPVADPPPSEDSGSAADPDPAIETDAVQSPVAEATRELPAREHAPLGKPDDVFSVSPSVEDADEADGLLASLDPRTNGVARVIAATGGVVGALVLVLKTLQRIQFGGRMRGRQPSGIVEVLARYPVARGQQLMLLSLGRRIVLVHQNGSSMASLAEMTDEQEVASIRARIEADERERNGQGFAALLRSFAGTSHSQRGARRNGFPEGGLEVVETVDLTRRSPSTPMARKLLHAPGGGR